LRCGVVFVWLVCDGVGTVYLRVTQRRNRGGDVVRYLQLAHNVRNERGVPVAKVIHTFGREDEVDREALVRLVASISRFLEPEQALAAGAPAGFDFIEARELGRPHVVASLWSELGIGRALGRAAGPRRFRRDRNNIFSIFSANWNSHACHCWCRRRLRRRGSARRGPRRQCPAGARARRQVRCRRGHCPS
jgi:hypothetical protein